MSSWLAFLVFLRDVLQCLGDVPWTLYIVGFYVVIFFEDILQSVVVIFSCVVSNALQCPSGRKPTPHSFPAVNHVHQVENDGWLTNLFSKSYLHGVLNVMKKLLAFLGLLTCSCTSSGSSISGLLGFSGMYSLTSWLLGGRTFLPPRPRPAGLLCSAGFRGQELSSCLFRTCRLSFGKL